MKLAGKLVVVTGAASGIGAATVRRFAAEDPRGLIAADRDAAAVEAVAKEVGCTAVVADVGTKLGIDELIDAAEREGGPVDVFFSNAGISGPEAGPEASPETWQLLWDVNVMAHVWAAERLAPAMAARGEGYLLSTASAAGLLMTTGYMPYSVTKAAAVSVAEYLAVEYGDAGVRVSCLCPGAVATPMLEASAGRAGGKAIGESGDIAAPAEIADLLVEAIGDERFLILSHPEIQRYFEGKASDHERWIAGMRALRARSQDSTA
jgi:NAD(P)-dependent dehydrogenase (short-subunit alcohol dehydrogenase family)